MGDVAIKVDNLGKMYRIGAKQESYFTFRDMLTSAALSPFRHLRRMGKPPREEETIWALKDVSFEVKRGEVVGIIGRNGAGKSTLLKILSRITEPTEGLAEIHGRVGSLLEVGTGFHPELTGRENIFLNGAILGMKKTETQRKFDEIVAFAEIEKFIDTPVKRYSSGMYVRLAFAVAAHLEPEILLVDEVLSVGDVAFQKKCLGRMGNVAEEGRTVLFVSHNMAQINKLCQRAILINDGFIKTEGPPSVVIDEYIRSSIWAIPAESTGQLLSSEDGSVVLRSFRVFGEDDQKPLRTGGPCYIELEFHFAEALRDPGFIVSIRSSQSVEIMRLSTYPISGISTGQCSGDMRCILQIDELLLTGGNYVLAVGLSIPKVQYVIPTTEVGVFEVLQTDYYSSGYNLANRIGFLAGKHNWRLDKSFGRDKGVDGLPGS